MKIERVTVSKTKNYKHPNVRIAQGLLIANDIDVGTIDGIAGNKFSQGIQIFQELNGIIPDGECGPKTWELLEGVGK
jgi:peptidoglycan hydrolase-like protein with peptidoglycan-binding domain